MYLNFNSLKCVCSGLNPVKYTITTILILPTIFTCFLAHLFNKQCKMEL